MTRTSRFAGSRTAGAKQDVRRSRETALLDPPAAVASFAPRRDCDLAASRVPRYARGGFSRPFPSEGGIRLSRLPRFAAPSAGCAGWPGECSFLRHQRATVGRRFAPRHGRRSRYGSFGPSNVFKPLGSFKARSNKAACMVRSSSGPIVAAEPASKFTRLSRTGLSVFCAPKTMICSDTTHLLLTKGQRP